MDGEIDSAEETGQEQQGQQVDQKASNDQQKQQETQIGSAPTDEEIRAALAVRDERIAELEAQLAETSKTAESAEVLAKQIEELKASASEERVGFELRLAGAHSVTRCEPFSSAVAAT